MPADPQRLSAWASGPGPFERWLMCKLGDLHPYCTVSLTVYWLPDRATQQAPAVLVGKSPAYRLTPAVHAYVRGKVEELEVRWAADSIGLTVRRRDALTEAARVLAELWDWMAARSANGTVATEPPRLPDVRKLAAEVERVERAPPLDEWNPTLPLPEYSPAAGADVVPVGAAEVRPKKRTAQRRQKGPGDSIATGTQHAETELFG